MRPHQTVSQRSAKNWAIRGMLALALLGLGYVSVSRSLANSLQRANLEIAHSLAPENGQVTSLLARDLAFAGASANDRARAKMLARVALQTEPTAVLAVVALAFEAQVDGDAAAAQRLFGYSQKLSRRDVTTQLWAVEDAVAKGDVTGALMHYDIVLRTSPRTADLLFPVLASAISDPKILSAATTMLADRPSWSKSFIDFVASKGPAPIVTANLLIGLHKRHVPVSSEVDAVMINSLITGDEFARAWDYYAGIRKGVDRRLSRDPGFAVDVDTPSLFDWVPINDGGVTTSIRPGDTGPVFDFFVPTSVGGALLQQMQVLPTGRYSLEGRGTLSDATESAGPYWVLSCRGGTELGRVKMANRPEMGGTFSGKFEIPANCPVQVLMLVARPSSSISGITGQIEWTQLRPSGPVG